MADDFTWELFLSHLKLLAIAFALALPVAWNRERSARSAGLRTFPMVAIASCAYLLVGRELIEASDTPSPDAHARLIQALATGLGFLGGGVIVKIKELTVRGLATAVSIWNTGAIGMAVAYQKFDLAILLSLINFAVLRFGEEVKEEMNG